MVLMVLMDRHSRGVAVSFPIQPGINWESRCALTSTELPTKNRNVLTKAVWALGRSVALVG